MSFDGSCSLPLVIRYERPAGLLVTLFVYIVYVIALRYEGYVAHA